MNKKSDIQKLVLDEGNKIVNFLNLEQIGCKLTEIQKSLVKKETITFATELFNKYVKEVNRLIAKAGIYGLSNYRSTLYYMSCDYKRILAKLEDFTLPRD